MSKKQKPQKLYATLSKFKSFAKDREDEELNELINELEIEINASFATQTDEEEGGSGGNNPGHKPGTP